jgi:hypothetical protein
MANIGGEIAIVVCSFVLFIGYHIWFFLIHAAGVFRPKDQKGPNDKFRKGQIARIQFSDLVCRDNDTIQGIQQNRNGLTGVAFMSATVSILAQKMVTILLDLEKREQMEDYAVRTTLTVFTCAVHEDFRTASHGSKRWK